MSQSDLFGAPAEAGGALTLTLAQQAAHLREQLNAHAHWPASDAHRPTTWTLRNGRRKPPASAILQNVGRQSLPSSASVACRACVSVSVA